MVVKGKFMDGKPVVGALMLSWYLSICMDTLRRAMRSYSTCW